MRAPNIRRFGAIRVVSNQSERNRCLTFVGLLPGARLHPPADAGGSPDCAHLGRRRAGPVSANPRGQPAGGLYQLPPASRLPTSLPPDLPPPASRIRLV